VKLHGTAVDISMRPGGVLLVRITGPITGSLMASIKAAVVHNHASGVSGFVADYRGAVVAASGSELDAILAGDASGSPARLPAAMIVRYGDLDLFAGHSLRMAALGIMRRVFLDDGPAEAWALREAGRHRAGRLA